MGSECHSGHAANPAHIAPQWNVHTKFAAPPFWNQCVARMKPKHINFRLVARSRRRSCRLELDRHECMCEYRSNLNLVVAAGKRSTGARYPAVWHSPAVSNSAKDILAAPTTPWLLVRLQLLVWALLLPLSKPGSNCTSLGGRRPPILPVGKHPVPPQAQIPPFPRTWPCPRRRTTRRAKRQPLIPCCHLRNWRSWRRLS